MANNEKIITPTQITHVILASHYFGTQEDSTKGIKAHQQSVHNVASRVQPVFQDFAPQPNQIPAETPQYISSEKTHQILIGDKKDTILKVRSDLEIYNFKNDSTLIIEIKPTPKIRHGIQTIITCMAVAKETNLPVEGGIFHYKQDSVTKIPQGGESAWDIIEHICLTAFSILKIQNTLDKDRNMRKIIPKNPNKTTLTWQPNLPTIKTYTPLSKSKTIELSDQAIEIRRNHLEPLVKEISPLISSWIQNSTKLST